VGIGTSSPSNKLEVATASTTSTALGFTVRNTDSTNDPKFQLGVGYPGYFDDAAIIQHNGTLTAYINSSGETNFITRVFIASNKTIQSQANGNSLINLFDASNNTVISAGNNLVFKTGTDAERMRIDSSGRLLIGRTASVSNANAEDMQIGNTSGAHGLTILSQNTHNGNIFFGDNDNNDAGSISYNHTNDRLEFHTNRSQKMTIASNGYVGIGTTSPARTLEVYANSSSMVSQFKSVSGDNAFICFANNSSTADQVRIGSTGSSLVLSTAFTERMRIDSTGNTFLQTGGAALQWQNGYQTITGDAASNDLTYRTYANHIWKTTTGASSTTDGTERMRIDSSGNVGIGTTSPSSYDSNADNLVIGGESAVGLTLASSATTGRGSIYFADGTSGDQKYRGTVNYFHNGDYLTITTAATERMRIDSSGNVGIGTSSPAAKLEIGGAGEGIILASPDGTRYEITVANGGTLTVTAV